MQEPLFKDDNHKDISESKADQEPLFKDENYEYTAENKKDLKYYPDDDDKKRTITRTLNFLSFIFIFFIPAVSFFTSSTKYFFYSIFAGLILSMISTGFNPKSKISKALLLSGIIIIIVVAAIIMYIINELINECSRCVGSDMP